MLISGIPAKFTMPWGQNAAGGTIRTILAGSQIGITAGAASLNDGFPVQTSLPVGAGGTPPSIQDFNGIFNGVTAWNQWQQAGGAIVYDSTFQTAVSGYPNRAVVASATTPGLYWRSTTDGNVTNPDTGGAGWLGFYMGSISTATSTLTTVGGQSISGNTYTTVQFPGTPTGFTNASGVLTCTIAGQYSLSSTILTSQVLSGAISIATFVEIFQNANVVAQNSDSMYVPGASTTFAFVGASVTV
jgi:hypothetical protein